MSSKTTKKKSPNPEEVLNEILSYLDSNEDFYSSRYMALLEEKGFRKEEIPFPNLNEYVEGLTYVEFSYIKYLREKHTIKNAYDNSESWRLAFGMVNLENDQSIEAYVDYVEETTGRDIPNGETLHQITKINEDDLYGKGNRTNLTPEDVLTFARYSKYRRELSFAINRGLRYTHLLKLTPARFGLPKRWDMTVAKDHHTSILLAIGEEFALDELENLGISFLPGLRTIANTLQAPYSVIMDAYKFNSFINPFRRDNYIKENL